MYTVTAHILPENNGTTIGSGSYEKDTPVTVRAIPKQSDYEFIEWRKLNGEMKLPYIYREIEYIEVTKGTGFGINTGIGINVTTGRVVMDFQQLSYVGKDEFFYSSPSSNSRYCNMFTTTTQDKVGYRDQSTSTKYIETNIIGKRTISDRNYKNGTMTINDISGAMVTGGSDFVKSHIYIGGRTSSSVVPNYRIFNFKIYEDDIIQRDFIPCINMVTDEAEFYDLIEGVFILIIIPVELLKLPQVQKYMK